jgi:hypothetical protein
LCGTIRPVSAKAIHPQQQEMQSDPGRGFEAILDLWRDGKFSELYARTIPSGKQSQESFIARLSSSDRKPACCWEKLQDVRVTEQGERKATLHAKVGLEGKDGSTEFITRQFRLHKADGVWKISMSDIISLSGKAKKSTRKRNNSKKNMVQSFYREKYTSGQCFHDGMNQAGYAFNFSNWGGKQNT